MSLIQNGTIRGEIADVLPVSKHTVDRHRQNILEKLRVNNSIDACRIVGLMNMFKTKLKLTPFTKKTIPIAI